MIVPIATTGQPHTTGALERLRTNFSTDFAEQKNGVAAECVTPCLFEALPSQQTNDRYLLFLFLGIPRITKLKLR